jgi:hypothetical protein
MLYTFDKVIPILFWLGFFALGITTSLDSQSKVYSKSGAETAKLKTTAYNATE